MAEVFKFPRGVMRRLREMMINSPVTTGLRNTLSALRSGFYEAPTTPALEDTKIDRDAARALYYNTNPAIHYGAFVAANIIDGTADYIGLPILTVGDEATDNKINAWVADHWASQLWHLYRTTLRDSEAWVRIRLPFPSPLLAPDEEKIPEIEVIDSDRVTPYYDPVTRELIRVEILTEVYIEDEPFDPAMIYATGARAHGRAHEIIEIISPSQYLYWDATSNMLLENFTTDNAWGFVPMLQVFNDYDESLRGGSSELEQVYPLLQPFHDIFSQTRTAFKYHSNPKVQVQVNDVLNFIRNNFPEAIGSDGQYSGKISWKDRDVFFMETGDTGTTNESMSFVTANLNIGDAQALLEMIIDFICIAAEVTEGILFRARASSDTTSEAARFKKKVSRKRENITPYIQAIMRMAMYVAMGNPLTPKLSWAEVDAQDLIDYSTAFANTVTALEVLSRSAIISKSTYRASVRRFIPAMKSDAEEASQAQTDIQQENQDQINLQTALANLQNAVAASTNGGGPNSATRTRVRAALPMAVTPSQPGE